MHFNPLPPYGGRRADAEAEARGEGISIHSLRMEGDNSAVFRHAAQVIFQSTPSVWRETGLPCRRSLRPTHFNPLPPYGGRQIAPVSRCLFFHFNPLPPYGGRHIIPGTMINIFYFNPLPPYGGRRYAIVSGADSSSFQSTPSVWRETGGAYCKVECVGISIHSLRMEGDDAESQAFSRIFSFQSTPSVWRETR